MFSKFALLSNLFLASAALAVPSSWLGTRLVRRRENRQSQHVDRVASPAGAVSNIEYSPDWCGAVLVGPPVRIIPIHDRIRSLFLLQTGNFHDGHRDLHCPHPFGQ